jgi:geranylgeranyl diphosphate synthase type II
MNPTNVTGILQSAAQQLSVYLEQVLQRQAGAPARLLESIRYSLLAGGKRLRPALVLETFHACADATPTRQANPNVRTDSPSSIQSALAAAAAVELIHTFSLVHDDLPSMDDDDVRRGIPTNHKVFGEAMAILAGDAMVTLAFALIATDAEPPLAVPLIRELAMAAGPSGMIGGQVLDMQSEHFSLSLDELQRLHGQKTGALLRAACRMGAIAAGTDDARLDAATAFGGHLGLAFQIVDDLLDVTESRDQLGKASGKDASRGKNTYPALLGVDASRRAADQQLAHALASLDPLGVSGENLRALARFVVQRKN